MAVNRNSNAFTFTFAIVMVLVVGAALAFASSSLKPLQVQNNIDKKMMSILGSVGVVATRKNAASEFYSYVGERILINAKGEVVETREGKIDPKDPRDPFNVDVKKQYRDKQMKLEDKVFPLFKAQVEGKNVLVVPMAGTGLWGPIWGFVALESDYNTVFGATFNHKSETPGLGAEISEGFFQKPFDGKKIYDEEGNLVSINVKKGGADPSNPHAVDAITGGTITSNGVTEMLERTFEVYNPYFKKQKTQKSEQS